MNFTSFTPVRRRSGTFAGIAALFLLAVTSARAATAPGGFIELNTTTTTRPVLGAATLQSLLPARGPFTFPAPYGTRGVRITNASDCVGGGDCVNYAGYSYWRNMNNHVGSNTMLVFLGLNKARGGAGPTLFSYDKTTDALTKVGPLFDASSKYAAASAEGWYFSATLPSKIYMNDGSRMLRYDVLAKTFETVYDANAHFGGGKIIWQMHSSNDDKVHSATVRDASSYAMQGCLVYREATRAFSYFPKKGDFDECQVDKSGRYLVIKENVDGAYGEDNRIIDLATNAERVLLDQNGAAGHSDLGHGTMVASDNMASVPNAVKLWNLGATTLQGTMVYNNTTWGAGAPAHVSYVNAKAGVAMNQQYACGSSANAANPPHANEVICFRLDGTKDVLVVAPVMTDVNASGGGDAYGKMAKGNLDVTGQYFLWTSNLGGSRLDAFIVRVPSQKLVGTATGGDTAAPSVTITAPAAGATLGSTATVSASASDDVGVVGVQFRVDGTNIGAEDTSAPYSVSFDTRTVGAGPHALTAVARDAAGNTRTSAAVSVTTQGDVAVPTFSAISAVSTDPTSAKVTWLTDEPADTMVEYGKTAAYGSSTPYDGALVTAHSATLTKLSAGTLYHYRLISWDANGNQAVSGDQTFTTVAASPTKGGGPIAHWKLDEGSGATAADASGYGRHGALINGPAWTAGVASGGLGFDGADDYVSVASSSALNAFPLTVTFWVKTTGTGTHGVVNKYYPSSMNGYQVFLNNGSVCAWYFRSSTRYVWDGSSCGLQATGVADGQWHHVAFVVNASDGRLYVDGALKATRAWTGAAGATSTTQSLSLGRYAGVATGQLPGTLDDVRVYARALSASEIAVLGLPRSGPVVSSAPDAPGAGTTTLSTSGPAAVTWTELVNAAASGGVLTKTGGCDGCQDAGAASAQEIGSTGGYLEFTATLEERLRYVGLSHGNGGTQATDVDFGLRLQGNYAEVRENGVYRWDTPLAAGDVFRIAVSGGVVSYFKNGTLLYKSAAPAAFPLRADAALVSGGATVSNAVISTTP